jgi:D-aspartate ligase
MLQEYIPGGDDTVWMYNGYFNQDSDEVVGFTGKKIRQCPIHTGSTSLGICVRNDEVAAITRRFMKAVGYRGILDIGYRYDARDGQYKVLDVNPRIGATFRLFVGTNGIDVARALYLHLTGQPVPSTAARDGRKWIVEDLDLVSSYRYFREGSLTFGDWLRSFRGIDEAAFLSWRDPAPMLLMGLNRSQDLGARIYQKLKASLVQPRKQVRTPVRLTAPPRPAAAARVPAGKDLQAEPRSAS